MITGLGSPNVGNLIAALAAPRSPAIVAQPLSQTAAAGATVTLSVSAPGDPAPTYAWQLNGVPIAGATSPTLALADIGANQGGDYSVLVTNSGGTVSSTAAAIDVRSDARLTNVSARAVVGTGGNLLIGGFSLGGSGREPLLLRGVGPGLTAAPFRLAGTLGSPQLTLYDCGSLTGESSPRTIAEDVGWCSSAAPGDSPATVGVAIADAAIMDSVGAFPLATGSADTAMLVTAPAGSYTFQIGGVGGATGVALAEIYDAGPGETPSHLTNISARASVGTGGDILIGGFAIAGTTSETVLIRGVGPGLANAPFYLNGTLAHPQLTLYDSGSAPGESAPQAIASNDGWGGSPTRGSSPVQAGVQAAAAAAMARVGAFSLAAGSADAAMLVTLPPGPYTVQLAGAGGSTGIGLVEIYEVQ